MDVDHLLIVYLIDDPCILLQDYDTGDSFQRLWMFKTCQVFGQVLDNRIPCDKFPDWRVQESLRL